MNYCLTTIHLAIRVPSLPRISANALTRFTKMFQRSVFYSGSLCKVRRLEHYSHQAHYTTERSNSSYLNSISYLLLSFLTQFCSTSTPLKHFNLSTNSSNQSVIGGTNTMAYLLQTAEEVSHRVSSTFGARTVRVTANLMNVIAVAKGSLYLGQKRLCLG